VGSQAAARRLQTPPPRSTTEIRTRCAPPDFLRVYVREPARAGLREQITDAVPNALAVRIDPEFASRIDRPRSSVDRTDRTPGELFAQFCTFPPLTTPGEEVARVLADVVAEATKPVASTFLARALVQLVQHRRSSNWRRCLRCNRQDESDRDPSVALSATAC
jgi:hypothetical protein